MSKNLSELLGQPEALVEAAIKQLEHLNGFESTDIRLLAEVNNKVRAKTKELGLDPDDTTGAELYHAVRVKLAKDEKSLALTAEEIIEKISLANHNHKVYALRHSAAKEILRSHPPRKLMKHLHYRSIDSMLKRENICELYAGLQALESSRWLNVFWKDLAKLTPSDFESQTITIHRLSEERWANVQKSEVKNITLLGAVMVGPKIKSNVSLALQISRCISQLRAACAYVKLRQVEADFGKNLVTVLQSGLSEPLEISHLPIGWQTIFHHYGQRPAAEHTEFFGPHLLYEDIKSHHVIKSLAKVFPVFSWWEDLDHVFKKAEDGLVSLNLADVIENNSKTYEQRSLHHARSSLWQEFIDRYLKHPSVEQHFMQQLEPQTVPIESLEPNRPAEQEIKELIEAGV